MPKTNSGRWSLGLIIAMPILFLIGSSLANSLYESVASGSTLLDDIANRPALAISMLIGFGSGIAAFITGLVAIIKQKDRAILVYLATIVGAGLIVFLFLEIVFPH